MCERERDKLNDSSETERERERERGCNENKAPTPCDDLKRESNTCCIRLDVNVMAT